MTLSTYHQKYANRSPNDMSKRIRAKAYELKQIFAKLPGHTFENPARVAIMGCADKRFVPVHREIFEKIVAHPVTVITFDITVEHLLPESDIAEWDCTKPLPDAPYDITYASVLLRFIETEKQWDVLKNSHSALGKNGVAIHILDEEDYTSTTAKLSNGYFSVPLNRWEHQLKESGIQFLEIPIKTGPTLEADSLALVLLK